ncbi:response regulator transcription factor [Nigerium sp.]|uniref:response regulator transcription factor n=1 Tax=Nigerium sp. TaxID=2042655 RepID=UPI003221702A
MTDRPVRILIADDHVLLRDGIKLMLEREPEFQVVGEAGDGVEALEFCATHPVDLAILDVSMPKKTGLQVARELSRDHPHVTVLMLSMHDNEQFLFEALKAGAAGYVHKSVAHRDLISACRGAMRGEPFLYPGAVATLIREFVNRGDVAEASLLTPREEEVLKLIAEGYTGRDIASMLVISPKTVERHRSNLPEKLGLRDRLELTRYAIRCGLIEP